MNIAQYICRAVHSLASSPGSLGGNEMCVGHEFVAFIHPRAWG